MHTQPPAPTIAHIDVYDGEQPLLFKLHILQHTLHLQQRQLSAEALATLISALQEKDHELYTHSYRTQYFTHLLAQLLNLPKAVMERVKLAALFHDIGKITISDEVLHKASRLTAHEFEKVQEHPERGAFLLEQIPMFKPIAPAVHFHHEWWNGSGYPYGLRHEDIPLGARIVTIADAFEVMTSQERVYQQPRTPLEALEELRRCAGTQFDPTLVDIFCTSLQNDLFPFPYYERIWASISSRSSSSNGFLSK